MADYIPEWQKSLPRELVPAIKALRKSFSDAHFNYGKVTEVFCYFLLHDNSEDKTKDYNLPLLQMRNIVGTAASLRFDQLRREGTPSAFFKAFHDLYLDGLKAEVRTIFLHLSEIGRANEALVGAPYLEWAYSYTKEVIADKKHCIRIWVRKVCDKQPYDPNEDDEEAIFWRKWQAPMFLIMKPSRYKPYDAATAWSRKDAKESAKLLDHFEDDYILRLKLELDRVHGSEAVRLAKQAKPQVGAPPVTDAKSADPAATETTASKPASVLREARKLGTKKKYKAWQREYKALMKSHPGKSDVWYSEKIARSTTGKGSSPATIRKNMK